MLVMYPVMGFGSWVGGARISLAAQSPADARCLFN